MTHHDRDQQYAGENEESQLVKQTPGLDPEPIREEAGPDWPPNARGDFESSDVVQGQQDAGDESTDGTWEGSQRGGKRA